MIKKIFSLVLIFGTLLFCFSCVKSDNKITKYNYSILFEDEIGKGECYQVLIGNRTYRIKTLYLNKGQEEGDINFLKQEIDRDLMDIGIVQKDNSIHLFFNKHFGLNDTYIATLQSLSEDIESALTNCKQYIERQEGLNFIEADKDKVIGKSTSEYFKLDDYCLFEKASDNTYHIVPIDLLLQEFGEPKIDINYGTFFEYLDRKYFLDSNGNLIKISERKKKE